MPHRIALLLIGLIVAPFLLFATPSTSVMAADNDLNSIWDGNWFTCEFAKSQSPPYDGCKMFDDEGFRFDNGRLTYIRITKSDETECKGNKVGQCFRRDRPAIEITSKDRGKLEFGKDTIKVRYFGCTQLFHFSDHATYREIEPDADRCWWARKRHFYIARYDGVVTLKK